MQPSKSRHRRRYRSHRLVNSLLVIWIFVFAAPLAAGETWKAGTARANITPENPMWMAGYASRNRPADGKLSDLWAKALVIEDADGDRALLITLDLIGIGRDLSVGICDRLNTAYGLPRQSIAICTSHTHSGPVVRKNLAPMHYALVPQPQQSLIREYAKRLEEQLIEISGEAIDNLQPSTLHHARGVASFAVNRRNNRPADKVPAGRAAGTLAGPIDHDVPVLAIKNSNDQLTAVVFGYACHATVLSSFQWCGDYPGYAQEEFERLHPGCQAMFWAGCGGDQNPLPRRTVELAQHYGRQLAGAVDAALLTSQVTEIKPGLETSYAEIDLFLDTLPTADELRETTKSENRYQQARAQMLLEKLESDGGLDQTYPYPIGVWKLGEDVRWMMLGGEVVVDYALRLKHELSGPVWIAGYTNDVMAYIPSRRVLREGGYEGATSMVYYGLPTTWSPAIEEAIVREAIRLAN